MYIYIPQSVYGAHCLVPIIFTRSQHPAHERWERGRNIWAAPAPENELCGCVPVCFRALDTLLLSLWSGEL